jgi:hypothetical protein
MGPPFLCTNITENVTQFVPHNVKNTEFMRGISMKSISADCQH